MSAVAILNLVVGVDACVLIEAVRLRARLDNRGRQHPSVRLLRIATTGAITLLLVAQVLREAEENLRQADDPDVATADLQALHQLLDRCDVVHCADAADQQLAADHEPFWQIMRHDADACIAVAVKHSPTRPAFFVSSNSEHWPPSSADNERGQRLAEALGGLSVCRPATLVRALLRLE